MNEIYNYDEDDFDPSDDEYPDDEYEDDELPGDDDAETLPCPECGQPVYEEAEQCPHCGQYVTFSSPHVFDNKPWWWVALGLFGVLAVLCWLVMAGG
jgi:rRNA maturation protein Nop10